MRAARGLFGGAVTAAAVAVCLVSAAAEEPDALPSLEDQILGTRTSAPAEIPAPPVEPDPAVPAAQDSAAAAPQPSEPAATPAEPAATPEPSPESELTQEPAEVTPEPTEVADPDPESPRTIERAADLLAERQAAANAAPTAAPTRICARCVMR